METLRIKTRKERDVVDITDAVQKALTRHPPRGEVVHLFVKHTTAALTTVPLRAIDGLDLVGRVEATVHHPSHPRHGMGGYSHYMMHLPAAVIAAHIGASLAVPVKRGKLSLGRFQRVVLLEFEGPGVREVAVISE